jgi:hypothetical protein
MRSPWIQSTNCSPTRIIRAEEPGRNYALNHATRTLGGRIAARALKQAEVEAALYAAAEHRAVRRG